MCFLKRAALIVTAAALLLSLPLMNAAADAGEGSEGASNRQVHLFSQEPVTSGFDVSGFRKVAGSAKAELWLNEQYGTLRIVALDTGYVWGALPLEDAEGLNKSWNGYGNSIAAIECFDESASVTRLSFGKDARVNYEETPEGLLCQADFGEVGIRFSVLVKLDGDRINFSLVPGSLEEGLNGSTYSIKSLTFLPYLGASLNDSIDGYLFIPDGSGALIRFQKARNYSSTYAARVYGSDMGITSTASMTAYYMKDEPQVYMPVYGVVHGARQNALFGVVESGAEYTSIIATPAQANNPYNAVSARFEYREKYVKNINRREGAGATIAQEEKNPVTPSLSLYVLTGDEAHYDGMAVKYRSILEQSGTLTRSGSQGETPLRVEVLGADKKVEFFGMSEKVFTTAEQAGEIAKAIAESGVQRLDMVYRCYAQNNEAGAKPVARLGDKEAFQKLHDTLLALGGTLYYRLDPLKANEDQITLRTEAANNLSAMEITTYTGEEWSLYDHFYYYRLSEAEKRVERAREQNVYDGSFALDGISHLLYSDFTSKHVHTRAENLASGAALTAELAESGRIPMYQPNEYLWQYASSAYDMPVNSGQYLYVTDTVPFLEMVLGGSAELFCEPMNVGVYSRPYFLRLIEYGVFPSFAVTACDSYDLFQTAQEGYYSTAFADWQPQMLEAYGYLSGALNQIGSRTIVRHECVEEGLIRVTYDNGARVYVNYTPTQKTCDGVTVQPNDYAVQPGN
ncbi:MAG TPA: DUF5696 domain-containing protein [Candidatus Cryosericum sp.]|nr:DUF5696 domain-containing protein [Candidatus Cryosericum sp.]